MSRADGGYVREPNGGIIGGKIFGAQRGEYQEAAGTAGVGDCVAVLLGGVGGN